MRHKALYEHATMVYFYIESSNVMFANEMIGDAM